MPLALVLGPGLLACAGHRPSGPELIARCLRLEAAAEAPRDTVWVGLMEPVELRHAPLPANEGEALVFRHLYEPLVQRDCRGGVVPAAATRWERDGDGAWSFSLRAGLRGAVTAAEVLAAWRRVDSLPDAARARSDSVIVLPADSGGRLPARAWTLRYALWTPGSESVVRGTRRQVVGEDRDGAAHTLLVAGGSGPVLRFEVRPGSDPRDLLDRGVDVVVTGDRQAAAYAATHGAFEVLPLPWRRTYALIAGSWAQVVVDRREELAQEVVPVAARAARTEALGRDAASCPAMPLEGRDDRPPAARRILFAEDDPVGRALAERLVALAPAGNVFADGVAADALTNAVSAGTDFAYVVPLDAVRVSCDELRRAGKTMLPVVEIRDNLIVRHGVGPVWVGGDGYPRLDGRP